VIFSSNHVRSSMAEVGELVEEAVHIEPPVRGQ